MSTLQKMKPAWIFAAAMFVSAVCIAADEKPKTYTLPKDAATPVIVMDHKGGMIMRKSDEPFLQVMPDGAVIVGDPWGAGRKVEGKITGDELQSLLRYVMEEQKFGEIQAADLRMKGRMVVMDAATTTISVQVDGAKQELAGRAVEMVAQQNGENSPAAHFVAVNMKLNDLANVIKLGGTKELAKFLDAANAKLKKDLPDDGQFEAKDLKRADAPAAGGAMAVFGKKVTMPDGKWHLIDVTVTQSAAGKTTVKVQKGRDVQPGEGGLLKR